MPISDKKKCTTLINIAAEKVLEIQAAANKLKALRAAFAAQNVNAAGTPLDGHVQDISTWIDAVDTVAGNVVANALVAHRVPTHRNAALEV